MTPAQVDRLDHRLFGRPWRDVRTACQLAGLGGLAAFFEFRHGELQASLRHVARECQVDGNVLNVRLRTATGLTWHQLLLRRRARAAALQLAVEPSSPLARIALACGFGSRRSLERTFSALFGLTPARFRRRWPVLLAGPRAEGARPDEKAAEIV